jgi:hypothetical protein
MKIGITYCSPICLRCSRQIVDMRVRHLKSTFSLRSFRFFTFTGWVPEMRLMRCDKVFSQLMLGSRGVRPELVRFSRSQRISFSVLLS